MKYVAIVVLCAVCVLAADKTVKFEVASIRPGAPGGTSTGQPEVCS